MHVIDRFRLCLDHRSTPGSCPALHESSDDKTHEHKPQNLRGHVPCDVVSGEFIPVPIFNVGAYRGKNTGDGHNPHPGPVVSSARGTRDKPCSKQCLQDIKYKFAAKQHTKVERT